MLRMIRRAPWIALGAAGAYYLDAAQGPQRRHTAVAKLQEWMRGLGAQWSGTRSVDGMGTDEPIGDATLVRSVSVERVRTRAAEPLAEEQAAGVSEQAAPAMAEQILQESESRVTDRAGTAAEHRRSEDTVAPSGAA